MPKRILVPLDGTPIGEAVLPHVAEIARALGAQVELLHVVPPRFVRRRAHESIKPPATGLIGAPAVLPSYSPSSTVLDSYHFDPGEVESNRRYVERLAEWLRTEGLDAQAVVIEGPDVAEAVLQRAAEVDLLALAATVGPHRRAGAFGRRLVFGSISERILHESRTPILLVRVQHHAAG
ncbi:MAG TPA: universal stress protein [Chloroflexota bacterium]|jgi:nucleotide-binding universal stress UspA family protein